MWPLKDVKPVAGTTLSWSLCQKTLRLGCFDRRRKAQATVEFSLIALPFFIILFATIDYAQIYFYKNSLQNAMREACRFATAGNIIQLYDSSGNPLYETNNGITMPEAIQDTAGREASRNECIRYWFQSNCIIHALPISNIVITSAPSLPGQPPTIASDGVTLLQTNGSAALPGPGNINDYVQVTATYTVQTITPLFSYLGGYGRGPNQYPCIASAIVKNEPAILNFLHTNMYPGEPGEP